MRHVIMFYMRTFTLTIKNLLFVLCLFNNNPFFVFSSIVHCPFSRTYVLEKTCLKPLKKKHCHCGVFFVSYNIATILRIVTLSILKGYFFFVSKDFVVLSSSSFLFFLWFKESCWLNVFCHIYGCFENFKMIQTYLSLREQQQKKDNCKI